MEMEMSIVEQMQVQFANNPSKYLWKKLWAALDSDDPLIYEPQPKQPNKTAEQR
jgi:hypothetical protein